MIVEYPQNSDLADEAFAQPQVGDRPPPAPRNHLPIPARGLPGKLTVDQLCSDLAISRSTFYDWRKKGTAPRCIRIPNGALRIRRTDYENWLADREDRA
ncbi:helix-turn-helix transcriptional regulator [Streptomyces sp. LE64]|uniref:helix-turn-helix transcriptional regulator n=1 Tax=Streptomyces sp. LE64 TaxID=3448653 RepID=UPI0040413106